MDHMDHEPSHRVLVVDDDPETTDIMHRLLTTRGYQVETAVDPENAMAKIETNEYAVVLSDILMPGISGHELTTAVLASGTGTQVILMTAYSSIVKVSEAYRLGASDYLLKPFENLDDVVQAVDLGIRRYQRWSRALDNSEPLGFSEAV